MSEMTWPPAVLALVRKGRIEPADVARLRTAVFGKAMVSRQEVEWAFALEARVGEACPEWDGFFVESVVDYVVWREAPAGHVTPEAAAWLLSVAGDDRLAHTRAGFDVVGRVVEAALSTPPELSAFVIRQVAAAVFDGDGPLADGRSETLDRDAVEAVRHVLVARGGDAPLPIERAEAEALFDLNDRLADGESDPAWSDLFVKAMATLLMAARGLPVPVRSAALRREPWLDEPPGAVVGLFGDALSSLLAHALRGVWRGGPSDDDAAAPAGPAAEEVRWLADRIGRDGDLRQNERALLRFLREESPDIHPSLRTLLDTAA